MKLEIWTDVNAFVSTIFPDTMEEVDLVKSFRNFERLLEEELKRTYPTAEIVVRVFDLRGTTILLDGQNITSSLRQNATSIYANVRTAMDKLFFYGQFWEDKARRD